MQNELNAEQPSTQSPWVSVLVLTRNEALHIERCIRSARRLSSHIFVIDSCSTDGTAELAKKMGGNVISRSFDSFSAKLNWSLANVDFPTPWVFRLDADEVFSEELLVSLQRSVFNAAPDVNGFYLRRQLWFMGRWIRHGGMYPTFSMRLWRKGCVRSEVRDLDEHMLLSSGIAKSLNLDIVDNPLTNLASWIEKHNGYSTLEARSVLPKNQNNPDLVQPRLWGGKIERTRWIKLKVFYRLPLFIRPLLYFLYRYIFKFGFLDGREGFLFHFMHGLWYRILVDGKIYEQRNLEKDI
ncbi:MAG: glycosyltransferase family 2 protein [Pseudomonadota bacterium]